MTKTSSEVQQQGDRIIKTTTTEVITKSAMQPQKKVSPFDKFRQLDRQNSLPNSPSPRTPTTPTTPGGSKNGGPLFAFTDPALAKRASTVKEQLLTWAQMKTKEYENVNVENFSSSWSDGLAFAALIHHFLPDAFDYSKLTPKERRHNFTLAFRVADNPVSTKYWWQPSGGHIEDKCQFLMTMAKFSRLGCLMDATWLPSIFCADRAKLINNAYARDIMQKSIKLINN